MKNTEFTKMDFDDLARRLIGYMRLKLIDRSALACLNRAYGQCAAHELASADVPLQMEVSLRVRTNRILLGRWLSTRPFRSR